MFFFHVRYLYSYTYSCCFAESPSSCGRPHVSDAHVVNLGQVSDVQVKREATSSPPPHPVQNVDRVCIKYYYSIIAF